MSAQQKERSSPFSEFKKISAALTEHLAKMIKEFSELFNAEAEPAEYGILFLKYINQFFDDKRKIVAAWHIFSLGLNMGKLIRNQELIEENINGWLAEFAAQSKKDGWPSA